VTIPPALFAARIGRCLAKTATSAGCQAETEALIIFELLAESSQTKFINIGRSKNEFFVDD
jgi:hypothetical protein